MGDVPSKATIAALLGTLTIGAALVFGLSLSGGIDGNSTPFITTILGFVGLSVVALIGIISNTKAGRRALNVLRKKWMP